MFSDNDLQQIVQHGTNADKVGQQIQFFKDGFPFLRIIKAATLEDGIKKLDDINAKKIATEYDAMIADKKIVKFVPASGAATRMFKDLYSFLDKGDNANADEEPVKSFFTQIEKFAFVDELRQLYQKNYGETLEQGISSGKHKQVLKLVLQEAGLNYGNLPKGLLKFHSYENTTRTPVEEHLVEGAGYGKSNEGNVYIHFTVSPEHEKNFTSLINNVSGEYQKAYGVKYNVSFSQQKPATDTIAVDLNNHPFREKDGSILFRPAGHGALLDNLNDIEADIIFIKNIDNVVPDHLKEPTITYKKAIAAILLNYQKKIFDYINKINANEITKYEEVIEFIENELSSISPQGIGHRTREEQKQYVLGKLNRPIRVCGMVKNEGEPGGGPFWVKNADGTISLQIVESSQVNMDDPLQKQVFKNATHFNPVDLVVGVKDYKGRKFNLQQFVDPKTGFISKKSKDGKDLKALELPGLWNGSMSDWNTIFVEVPVSTFNPVKTVTDLLRKEHQLNEQTV